MKKYFLFVLLMTCAFSFTACSDDEDGDVYVPFTPTASSGAYVMNQGNYYSKIASSIGYLDYGTSTMTDSVFVSQNGISAGNSLQAGLVYGKYLFAIAYESNVMFVADQNTLKLQKTLKINAPRALAASDGYVFVSNYNGYVTRVDAQTLTVKDSIKVGPNPEEMAVANGYLYVANSDGMDTGNDYAGGKSVSKIKISTFKVEKTIAVGLNPIKATSDEKGNVYVIAMGDYVAVPSVLQKIDVNDNVTDLGNASSVAASGSTIYVVYTYTDWSTYETYNSYFTLNVETGAKTDNMLSAGVDYPTSIAVDPITKHIFLTSDNPGAWGSADWSAAGYVSEYSATGTFIKKYPAGVHPVQVVFNVK